MDHYVITIARQYGSGGRTIGQRLSKDLGIAYYDKDIIRLASDDSGIHPELFGRVDEYSSAKPPIFGAKSGVYSKELIPPQDKNFTSDENLFNYQAKIIRELATKEDCVIIGRCANLILDVSEFHNVLRVYVHAAWDFRVEEAMQKMGGSQKDIEKFLRKDDKRKMEFCQRYTGKEWTDPSYYDLYLDSSVLGFDGVYEQIVKKYNAMRNR